MNISKLQLPTQALFRLMIWLVAVAAIAYCAACLFIFFQQPRLVFFPSSVIKTTPEVFGLPYEEVWLPVSVGEGKVERIHGWWIQAKEPHAKALLYLHGNGINIGANLGNANRFHQLGYSVLLIDYRGYGHSEGGFPNEGQVYQDAVIAWDYLVEQRGIPGNQILIYGHSLGGAIAIDLAVRRPEAAGLIVESSFTSIRKILSYRNNYWMFPVDLILTQRFESIKKIPRLKMPVLFIHGTTDSTLPAFMSQHLYDAAPEPKQLIFVPGAEHNNVADVAGVKYLHWVRSFVERLNKAQHLGVRS
jgi:uncharacterized protein